MVAKTVKTVFSISLLVCLLLVRLQAKPYTIQAPGVLLTAQTRSLPGSRVARPQSLPFSGSSNFGDARPLRMIPGGAITATQSNGRNKNHFNITSKYGSNDFKPTLEHFTSIWECQRGTPTLLAIDDYKKFSSKSTYIILDTVTSESEEGWPYIGVYYWIGNQSSDEDVAIAANIAMLNTFVHNRLAMKLHRETEGHESNAFKKLFKSFEAELNSNEKASEEIDTNESRIFMIEGKNGIESGQQEVLVANEVEIPLAEVLKDERSCFVFALGELVYISCGAEASVRYKFGAQELAKIMMKRKGLTDEQVETYRTDKLFSGFNLEGKILAKFFEKFEHLSERVVKQRIDEKSAEFTAREVRKILDQTATRANGREWFNVKVTRLFENTPGDGVVQEENVFGDKRFLTLILEFHSQDCFLVDSKSNVGSFVWVGKDVTTEFAAQCASQAELYLRREDYEYANRITFVHQDDLPLEVETVQSMIEFLVANDEDDSQDLTSIDN